jgi:hypothetical protein
MESIKEIIGGPETLLAKGEFFGFWANRIFRRYLQMDGSDTNFFNSETFDTNKKLMLSTLADKLEFFLSKEDPLAAAGNLNYIISATYWGILGDAPGVEQAPYGMRAYFKGILEHIAGELKARKNASESFRIMCSRRYLVTRGVISNIMDEAYRRRDAVYEDGKIEENGDIWTKPLKLKGCELPDCVD